MFISWLGQNIYQSEMSAKKSNMERNVQFVNAEMSKALTWMWKFQEERRKDLPDPEIILNAAIGYAETTGTIVEAASKVDPTSAILKKHVDEHKQLLGALRVAAQKRDIKDLETGASVMMRWFRGIGPQAHLAMKNRAQAVSDEEEKGKWIFRGFFLLGSLVLAGTWVKTNVSALR